MPKTGKTKLGFLKAEVRIPDDFNSMASREIRSLFEGEITDLDELSAPPSAPSSTWPSAGR